MATGQFLRPAGQQLLLNSRPVDLALHPNGKWLYVKENRGLTVVDVARWKVIQELAVKGGSSQTGILVHPGGEWLYVSNAESSVWQGKIGNDGRVSWEGDFPLPKPKLGGEAYPTGMALADDDRTLYVCASRSNQIVMFDTRGQNPIQAFDTDIAPYDLALHDGTLYVSCWGGKRPIRGVKTAPSAGTEVEVDERGIAKGATVAIHTLGQATYRSIPTGLQPSEIAFAPDGRAFVANANDDTVLEISADLKSIREIVVSPQPGLPFGSAPNALSIFDGKLFVAAGGNNAVGVYDVTGSPQLVGFLPVGWYPAAIAISNGFAYVANVKGIGSRRKQKDGSYSVYNFTGSLTKVSLSELGRLQTHTQTVRRLNAIPAVPIGSGKSEPVPRKMGRSPIEHVVYIIKENRTYDQIFGDVATGDGDPKLCTFGRNITPNHHALAQRFGLLDNYYCNGINSADGHAWSVEGNATSHFERSFGGWTRSYPFGDDPLSPSFSGFLWDNVLKHGRSFYNFGEFDYATEKPDGSWVQFYQDWRSRSGKFHVEHNIGVERVRRYSHPQYPGWDLDISDQYRAQIFLDDLKKREAQGAYPNLTIIYLPQDHTSGTAPGNPTPRACVADNDLALGKIVDCLSHSKFWKKMAIFVIEDDPQNGFDHVDGHRSICLVISPYSQRGGTSSRFYNQTSVLATMQRILGVPPMNQMDARSPIMFECFTSKPNYRPYSFLWNRVAIDEQNPPKSELKGEALKLAEYSTKLPKDKPDQMNATEADFFNRAIWGSVYPNRAYPAGYAGAHGRGLKKRGLRSVGDPDDD
ncbi:MAG TPA: alkaline phosphatase family protein [Fimbriimonadaceae bacterium]|nr:alkaline phosphatase family protein [Fimbriimonadaceae bacterium]